MPSEFFASGVLAYVGMLALCQGLERHYKQVWQRVPRSTLRRGLRATGWLSLGLSFYCCLQAWGPAIGPVGWFGLISLSGFALVLLLPYRPRLAVWLPAGLLPLWLLMRVLEG